MTDNDHIRDFVRDMKAGRTASVMWSNAYIGYEETVFSQELTIKSVAPESVGGVLKKLTDVIAAESIDGNLSG